jgi:hypothetical protein
MKRLLVKFFVLSVLMFGWHLAGSFLPNSPETSVIDLLQSEHYLSSGSGMRDGRSHIEYEDGFVLRHKTVNPFSLKNLKTAHSGNFSRPYKKVFSSCTSTFFLVKDSRITNTGKIDEFLIRLSYETSGLLATVNRLFTIESIRC